VSSRKSRTITLQPPMPAALPHHEPRPRALQSRNPRPSC
jgi:hypothetical protein